MDLLKEKAILFSELLDYEFEFLLGKKNIEYRFVINFLKADFHHIIGLKKLIDLEYLNGSRDKIFNNILNDKITYEMLTKSKHFYKIKDRIDDFSLLSEILHNKNLVFKYVQRLEYSKIPADYLIVRTDEDKEIYMFIKKRGNQETYCCNSFFRKDRLNYSENQKKLTLLKVEKRSTTTDETILIYLSPSYVQSN